MADLKTIQLELPARSKDMRALEIGSVAYLTGRVFTAREGVYKRAVEDGAGMPAPREALGLVNFHCSPAASVNADGSYTVGAVTATAEPPSPSSSNMPSSARRFARLPTARTESISPSLSSEIPAES